MGEVRVGVSGWRYPEWRGRFYPRRLAHRSELIYASRRFNSLEINGSFYALQLPESYQRWHDETPADFVFAVKGSRFITHMKRLRDVETALASFFASGVLRLEDKLGPILWQLPAPLGFDVGRFEAFLELLPRTTSQAARLARRHEARRDGPARTRARGERRLRYAFELRHPSFFVPRLCRLLARHQAAFVCADSAGHWPYAEEVTADFVYLRLHGPEELYTSGYTSRHLDRWARRIRAWMQGREPADAARVAARPAPRLPSRDVFVYFNNTARGFAPFNAMDLAARLGLRVAGGAEREPARVTATTAVELS